MKNTRTTYVNINWQSILFTVLGIYMVIKGHPGWGLFSCCLGVGGVYIKTTEEGESNE